MFLHPRGQRFHFVGKLRQGRGVTLGQLPNAPGQRLRNAIQLTLHGGGQMRHPLTIHHQRLDFGYAELRIFLVSLLVQCDILLFHRPLERGFLFGKLQPAPQDRQFLRPVRISADLLDSLLDGGSVDPLETGKSRLLPAVFLLQGCSMLLN